MQLEEELTELVPDRDTLLTIGVFDGVHLGHQHLIGHLNKKASEEGLLGGVVTFRSHPQLVLSPRDRFPCLTSLEERAGLLKGLGVELTIILSFTLDLAKLSAREFVSLLKKHLRMQGLVIGPDFVLGHGREGDATRLRTLGQEMGFTLDVVSPMLLEGEVASSSAIRRALSEGDMIKVGKLLGRPFSFGGEVTSGVERGRVLGFPTANLAIDSDRALPPDGVYVTRAYVSGEAHQAVTNIGKRPTFGDGERTVEVYLLDFEGDLYGGEVRIDIMERLRGEQRFANSEELRAQIMKDVERTRAVLGV